ncbi:uncharacterized protein STEHIDRAFT_163959 [Stereum hirsutum FP-91666 SS1]|uniref:Uncharacterized protein n=1 Tax=Stereum hirsutum (strain FP-91666) TaxID=721885 RepID=R7RWG6_STEHR|nr:uncharacterized protein STEHIDRAFT_163959 [Stereum hirsutum FP-91666 SS1]EIM79135.1 hypothetical protein STEHIDRAFT_163959 [Stereum hirsutum FP-91666 SS1]
MAVSLLDLNLSSYLITIFSASLVEVLKTAPRTVLLISRNDAFQRLNILGATASCPRPPNPSSKTSSCTTSTMTSSEPSSRTGLHPPTRPSRAQIFTSNNTPSRTGVIHKISDVLIPGWKGHLIENLMVDTDTTKSKCEFTKLSKYMSEEFGKGERLYTPTVLHSLSPEALDADPPSVTLLFTHATRYPSASPTRFPPAPSP